MWCIMLKRIIFPLFIGCCALAGCSGDPASSNEGGMRELTSLEKELVDSGEEFGIKLFREIVSQEERGTNLFISPLSVSFALGMTWNGAAGETRTAMGQAMELQGLTPEQINESFQSLMLLLTTMDPKVTLEIANSIWYKQEYTFRETFLNICRSFFDAEVTGVDMLNPATIDIINGWVSDNTHGKIPDIIDDIDPMVVMYLINALYFKGTWMYEFDPGDTQGDIFTKSDGSTVACRMMSQTGTINMFANAEMQAVDMPYGNGAFSMAVLVPAPGRTVDELITSMTAARWSDWMDSFTEQNATLLLPKFKIEYELKMNDVLKALGMSVAFGGAADFTNMYEPGGLYISEVRHKTFVDVNEEGTEAAAVTSVEIRETSMPLTMRVDAPFLFVIRETQTDGILFIGRVEVPTL